MTQIIIPIVLVAAVGLAASVMLSYASKVFEVKEDPKFLALRAELPGANCGGCGFAGCDDYAHALAENPDTPCSKCSVGGPAVAKKLGALLGKDAGHVERNVAFVMCGGTPDKANHLYDYEDLTSCRAAKQLFGGSKECPFGCIGLGDCVNACEFDAMHLVNGVAVVDRSACTACGKCMQTCPQSLIRLVPDTSLVSVRCHNTQKGADAKRACSVSCIGCRLCEKACEHDAVHVADFLSSIDPEKCVNCGACAAKCPTGAIRSLLPKAEEKTA